MTHIRNLGAGNWQRWKAGEAMRASVARFDVRYLSVRDALLEVRSLIVAQALLAWRARGEGRSSW